MADLKFEYNQRWAQLMDELGIQEPQRSRFLEIQEERDRQLEDYLATLSGGGSSTLNGSVLARRRFGSANGGQNTLLPDGAAPESQTLVRPEGLARYAFIGSVGTHVFNFLTPTYVQVTIKLLINSTSLDNGGVGTPYDYTLSVNDFWWTRIDVDGNTASVADLGIDTDHTVAFNFYFDTFLLDDIGVAVGDSFTVGIDYTVNHNPGAATQAFTRNATLMIFQEPA